LTNSLLFNESFCFILNNNVARVHYIAPLPEVLLHHWAVHCLFRKLISS